MNKFLCTSGFVIGLGLIVGFTIPLGGKAIVQFARYDFWLLLLAALAIGTGATLRDNPFFTLTQMVGHFIYFAALVVAMLAVVSMSAKYPVELVTFTLISALFFGLNIGDYLGAAIVDYCMLPKAVAGKQK